MWETITEVEGHTKVEKKKNIGHKSQYRGRNVEWKSFNYLTVTLMLLSKGHMFILMG